MSLNTMASPPPEITSSSRRKGNYNSVTPPPMERVSFDPAQVGRRYGWAEIVSPERRRVKSQRVTYVETRCTGCGTEAWINLSSLVHGRSKGCRRCSQPRRIPRWLEIKLSNAIQRCTNKKDREWVNYGGRGIELRFSSMLEAALWILANIGERPSLKHELDRINNDGHYEPGNLRWATRHQQANNMRRSIVGEWDYRENEWPYTYQTTRRLKQQGLTRAEILYRAVLTVKEKGRHWRRIAARLASLTS
jgi:hypothetical protein